ncbi:SOS response-associated peptidase [Corynebacterium freiburgense]|uniref:SOS response-associated peptidase n=1 Tax=Corynebacterium freiburgense TaxID=556548 RepID=UPI00041B13BE|nr:SOS response-associated peptidase [Corynebacterium freiburgense]WJZ01933.1 Putative SOS response-associated peptidase YedK [Corynebacterium freiburgense]
MCGRFVLFTTSETLLDAATTLLGRPVAAPHGTPAPRYNIAPTHTIAIINETLQPARWGFSGRTTLFNARAETLAEKPSFAWAFRNSRILIPMDGYYEWHGGIPYYVSTHQLLWTAGLYRNGEATMVTTAAPPALEWLHHRAPLLLAPEQANTWLNEPTIETMQPTSIQLQARPANSAVGNVANDYPELLQSNSLF